MSAPPDRYFEASISRTRKDIAIMDDDINKQETGSEGSTSLSRERRSIASGIVSNLPRRGRPMANFNDGSWQKPDVSAPNPSGVLVDDYFKTLQVRYEAPAEYARETVRTYAQRKWGISLDPDEMVISTLYIETAGRLAPFNANVAFSMTLTEAMLRNWQQNGSGEFLEHLGTLKPYREGGYAVNLSPHPLPLWDCIAYEAVYRKTTPQRYDASTHLPMRADEFKQYVWDSNLQAHYLTLLDTFWREHEDNYNLLIKGALLKAAYTQAAKGALSVEDKKLVLNAMGLDANQAWDSLTYEHFLNAPLSDSITFRELIIYRYVATDIIVIRDEATGRVILYIPGNSSPLHGFDSEALAKAWIGQQCRDPRKRKSLESHFKMEDDADGPFLSGLHAALMGLAVYPKFLNQATGYWPPQSTIKFGPAVGPWPFSHFRRNLQDRLTSDGVQSIRTRSDYWKDAAAHGVTNSIVVLGLVAMVAPEVIPALLVMSTALIGLGIDKAVEGRTLEEKQQGLEHIEFGVLNALPIAAGKVIEGAIDASQAVARGAEESTEVAQSGRSLPVETNEATRLAEQDVRVSVDDHERSFGIEPPGLRSLQPVMRAKLNALEYTLPLEGSTSSTLGAGVFQVFDEPPEIKNFIRLHSKVYRVEWVDAAKQFRIVAPSGDGAPGPFVKLSGGRWDLDLKLGLRGGDSFDGTLVAETQIPNIFGPQVVEPPIILQPNIPKVQIDIPIDGVEKVEGHYFISLNGKRVSVYFDADPEVACWKTSPIDYVWRDGTGKWRSGDAAAYKKIENKIVQSVNYEIYTFPRLPKLPENATPINREVHHIWMGSRLPSDELLTNISRNAGRSPDLKFILHIDIDSPTALDELSARFINHPSVHISPLKEEPFFNEFLKSKYQKMFNYFRHGDYQNLAAASDILRYRLIYEYDGIYMDCDDVLSASFVGVPLNAGPSDVLMGNRINASLVDYVGPNTSHFASHAGNPVLNQLLEEMHLRFLNEDPAFFTTPRPRIDNSTEELRVATKKKMGPYMKKIFELTGPGLFSDVISKARPDYFDLLARGDRMNTSTIVATAYTEHFEAARDFYFPFKRKAPIFSGSANEW
jgi:Glycosyltransferase sugar-binding region containing DXD motif